MRLHTNVPADRVVLKLIPLSILLNTHRNSSPGKVGGGSAGMNVRLTCSMIVSSWAIVGFKMDLNSPNMRQTEALSQTEGGQSSQCQNSCSALPEVGISWYHCCSDTGSF